MSKFHNPLVTIGISCFNSELTVRRAIQSALNQDWKNKEIIIVDDCSSDGSAKIIKEYNKQPGIRISLKKNNDGIGQVRNEIINLAYGHFLTFFDDDDESRFNRVSLQMQRITSELQLSENKKVVCYCGRELFDDHKFIKYIPPLEYLSHNNTKKRGDIAKFILTGNNPKNLYGSTATCTLLATIDAFNKTGGFDNNFRRSEDTEFAVRADLANVDFVSINIPLVRQNQSYGFEKTISNEMKYTLQYIEKFKDFINVFSSTEFCKQWVKFKFKIINKEIIGVSLSLIKIIKSHPILFTSRVITTIKVRILRFIKKSGYKIYNETSGK